MYRNFRDKHMASDGAVASLVKSFEGQNTMKTREKEPKHTAVDERKETSTCSKETVPPLPEDPLLSKIPSQTSVSTVLKTVVEAVWQKIEEQTAEEIERREKDSGEMGVNLRRSGWKTVRIFVSSTFTDMHSEREILVKKVFPELREWCEERKFTLVECDLRWGVPKDSTSRTTICTCLEEIDRCMEDNDSLPFFISILSDRYGWVPSDSEVPDDVKDKYQWVPHVSITHMEILHGAYRFNNPNAIFCFRNSSYIKDLPSNMMNRFVDKEELNQVQLKILKEKLAANFLHQVFDYNCDVDGIDMSTGREKVNIVGLEAFAGKVLQFLKDAISRQYPDHHLSPELSSSEIEENAHLTAMKVKSEYFVGRADELQSLLTYAKDGRLGTLLKQDEEEEDAERTDEEKEEKRKNKEEEIMKKCEEFGVQMEDSCIVCVTGEPGIGKSCLLAQLAKTAMQDGLKLIYHSVGATSLSKTSEEIMERIILCITGEKAADTEAEKKDGEEEIGNLEKFKKALQVTKEDARQLLIIIDGLDELSENQKYEFLSWLPPRFPGNVCCIVGSAINHYPCIARLKSRDSYFLHLMQLTPEGAASMANYYLQRFNKKLDADQMSSLLGHKSSCIPLWMSIACEELRVFGDFATVSAKIRGFPDELNELIKDVMKRLIREDDTAALEKVLSWICCSASGLPEGIILSLLGNLETKEEAPMATWATVRRHLKLFIHSTGESQSLKIQLAHSTMKQAATELLFAEASHLIKCHTYLADFYQYHCNLERMTTDELPHHLYNAKLGERMITFFRTDVRSVHVNALLRSQWLSKLRCPQMVFDLKDQSATVYLCQMCSLRSRILSPNPMPSRDLCAICGSWAPWKQPSNVARMCMTHKAFAAPGTTKCYVCNNMIFLNSQPRSLSEPLHLCNYCHVTGSTIVRCAHLSK